MLSVINANLRGLMAPPIDKLTADGYDLQYGTNVLGPSSFHPLLDYAHRLTGHFLFTELLVPALAAGAHSTADKHSRIVTTSSAGAHMFTVDFDALKDGPVRRKLVSQTLYFQSKFVSALLVYDSCVSLT